MSTQLNIQLQCQRHPSADCWTSFFTPSSPMPCPTSSNCLNFPKHIYLPPKLKRLLSLLIFLPAPSHLFLHYVLETALWKNAGVGQTLYVSFSLCSQTCVAYYRISEHVCFTHFCPGFQLSLTIGQGNFSNSHKV